MSDRGRYEGDSDGDEADMGAIYEADMRAICATVRAIRGGCEGEIGGYKSNTRVIEGKSQRTQTTPHHTTLHRTT